jgi:hypothetical protein
VEAGMPVFEVAPEEETLEGFYLALMKKNGDSEEGEQNSGPPGNGQG